MHSLSTEWYLCSWLQIVYVAVRSENASGKNIVHLTVETFSHLDPTVQAVKKIPSRYSGCGIRSASFQGDTLTVGTGLGMLMFYDVRAGKYLESSINASRTVVLKASKGYVVSVFSRLSITINCSSNISSVVPG